MGFQLKPNETVPGGLKRIVRKEIDKAIAALTADEGVDRSEAVHDARRAFKKVRAVLKLVRKELGKRCYERENVRFRDAGRPLTEVRDAQVLVEILDKLAERFSSEVSQPSFEEVRQTLAEHERATAVRVFDQENAPRHVIAMLKRARRRVQDWPLQHAGWNALAEGLQSTYGRGRKAFAAASVEPTVENFHEYRKRVKDLWHQLQIIHPMQPLLLGEEASQTHNLADLLGDEHDLAVLSQFLTEAPAKFGDPSAVAALLALVVRRRTELQQAAKMLGKKVHRERPRDFVARLHDYWRRWPEQTDAREVG